MSDMRISTPEMLPAIFFGHGNPMNVVTQNIYTEARWRLGTEIPKPKTILSISAHWFVPGVGVTVSTFETEAKQMMLAGEHKPLVEYEKLGPNAILSIPTPDHYLPLL